tara:strand:- start:345 stop:1238 length:894 start_codon:yes stop_codon:yes gene_type:complete
MITFDRIGHLGRLANQMFQYSTLFSIAHQNNYDFAIPSDNSKVIDSSYNPIIDKPDYMYLQILECFQLTGKVLPLSEIEYNSKYDHGRDYAKYSPEVFNISDGTSIKGYFQSYKYFDSIAELIKKEFTFKPLIESKALHYINNLKKLHSVDTITGVHIRHGDVKSEKGARLVLLNKEYYKKAMSKFASDSNLFLIFSDDVEWCRENLDGNNVAYSTYSTYEDMEPKAEFMDLCCMTHCNNLIMACSSYSWWGAYLNKNNGNIVVPSKWWGPQYSNRTESDIRLPSWTIQEAESNYTI